MFGALSRHEEASSRTRGGQVLFRLDVVGIYYLIGNNSLCVVIWFLSEMQWRQGSAVRAARPSVALACGRVASLPLSEFSVAQERQLLAVLVQLTGDI